LTHGEFITLIRSPLLLIPTAILSTVAASSLGNRTWGNIRDKAETVRWTRTPHGIPQQWIKHVLCSHPI